MMEGDRRRAHDGRVAVLNLSLANTCSASCSETKSSKLDICADYVGESKYLHRHSGGSSLREVKS